MVYAWNVQQLQTKALTSFDHTTFHKTFDYKIDKQTKRNQTTSIQTTLNVLDQTC